MFGIDFSERLVIFGIALVVLGPEKLPKLANTIGRWIGRARGMARQFREQLEQESGTLKHSVDTLKESVDTLKQSVDLGPEFGGRGAGIAGTSGASQTKPAPAATAVQPTAAD
ncbi:MAG: Sec-independent protein translocase protein TatB, partial [Steroidobacteraceae bacterium]